MAIVAIEPFLLSMAGLYALVSEDIESALLFSGSVGMLVIQFGACALYVRFAWKNKPYVFYVSKLCFVCFCILHLSEFGSFGTI